jgi:hypothetical protein
MAVTDDDEFERVMNSTINLDDDGDDESDESLENWANSIVCDVARAAEICGVGERRLQQILAAHGVERVERGKVRFREAFAAYIKENFPEAYARDLAEYEQWKLQRRVRKLEAELRELKRAASEA